MENVDKQLGEIIAKLSTLSEQLGPQAYEAVLLAAYGQALTTIVSGFVAFVISLLCFAIGGVALWAVDKRDCDESAFFVMFITWIGGIIFFIIAGCTLFDMTAWMALSKPEVYIAAKVLKL